MFCFDLFSFPFLMYLYMLTICLGRFLRLLLLVFFSSSSFAVTIVRLLFLFVLLASVGIDADAVAAATSFYNLPRHPLLFRLFTFVLSSTHTNFYKQSFYNCGRTFVWQCRIWLTLNVLHFNHIRINLNLCVK